MGITTVNSPHNIERDRTTEQDRGIGVSPLGTRSDGGHLARSPGKGPAVRRDEYLPRDTNQPIPPVTSDE